MRLIYPSCLKFTVGLCILNGFFFTAWWVMTVWLSQTHSTHTHPLSTLLLDHSLLIIAGFELGLTVNIRVRIIFHSPFESGTSLETHTTHHTVATTSQRRHISTKTTSKHSHNHLLSTTDHTTHNETTTLTLRSQRRPLSHARLPHHWSCSTWIGY